MYKQVFLPVLYCALLIRIIVGSNVDTWAVKIAHTQDQDANQLPNTIAKEMGLTNQGRIEPFQNWYKFTATSTKNKRDVNDLLNTHPKIISLNKQTILKRTKRLYFDDPKFKNQWHLHNRREVGHDVNASWVWSKGVTGRGVVIAIVDDGVERNNPDLINNYVSKIFNI